ncbi:MAG: hypothetical protein RMK32_02435 [Anaerolineae bacterium]|nr:hypothetical protein [Anaerolineae bacterium]
MRKSGPIRGMKRGFGHRPLDHPERYMAIGATAARILTHPESPVE